MRSPVTLLAVLCLVLPLAAKGAEDAKPASVAKGRQVTVEYTLTLDDGSTAETNVGGEPLVFEQGAQQILPALEEALEGMKASESRKVTLPPEKGYGPTIPELVQEVDPALVPEEARHAGAQLAAEDQNGERHFARVHEVREDKILVDMNHPLAGRTLTFEVKVISID
jgi:FKBP-type peptidyl-prolyl cis-trans isomerase SlyD